MLRKYKFAGIVCKLQEVGNLEMKCVITKTSNDHKRPQTIKTSTNDHKPSAKVHKPPETTTKRPVTNSKQP